eukprot:TRINITY_DN973_c0_g1_i1.p1 TRINITY_DN973_c0_g1~~TRINITY_DN973_c0_g1_i1.p1  ORF type:complete len:1660 (+),score=316.12 TRINITY_DN973_c0_g1_i1:106-5085(+)
MGGQLSHEEQLVEAVKSLESSPEKWPSVIDAFLKEIPEGSELKLNDRKLLKILLGLLDNQLRINVQSVTPLLETLRRILWWEGMFKAIPKFDLEPVYRALRVAHPAVVLAALRATYNIVQKAGSGGDGSMECENKEYFVKSKGLEAVVEVLPRFAWSSEADAQAVVDAALVLLDSVLHSHIHTSDMDLVMRTLALLAPHHGVLAALSAPPHPAAIKLHATAVMRSVLLESDQAGSLMLQEAARQSGALLWHVGYAIADTQRKVAGSVPASTAPSAKSSDLPTAAVESDEDEDDALDADPVVPALVASTEQRLASRELVGLLCEGNQTSRHALERVFQQPLLQLLSTASAVAPQYPKAKEANRSQRQAAEKQSKNLKTTRSNWNALFAAFDENFETETLIWNAITRAELQLSVAAEVGELLPTSQWDWQSFDAAHPSVAGELRAGPFYLRLLLPKLASSYAIPDVPLFIRQLYEVSVVEDDASRKAMVFQVVAAILRKGTAGSSSLPMAYLAWLLQPAHVQPQFVIPLLSVLTVSFSDAPGTIKQFIDANGMLGLIHQAQLMFSAPTTDDLVHIAQQALGLLAACAMLPRGRHMLCSSSLLPQVTRLLLLDAPGVAVQAGNILAASLPAEKGALTRAYRSGLFECALYRLVQESSSGSENLVQLLSTLHMQQTGFSQSYLAQYLPPSMVELLSRAPKEFAAALHSTILSAALIWNNNLLGVLRDGIAGQLLPVFDQLKSFPHNVIRWPKFQPIQYLELDDYLFVAGIYLDYYVSDTSFLVKHPDTMLVELSARLSTAASPNVVKLAQGIDVLLKRQPNGAALLPIGKLTDDVMKPLLSVVHRSPSVDAQVHVLDTLSAAQRLPQVADGFVRANGASTLVELICNHQSSSDMVVASALKTLSAAASSTSGGAVRSVLVGSVETQTAIASFIAPAARVANPAVGSAAIELVPAISAPDNAVAAEKLASLGVGLWLLHAAVSAADSVAAIPAVKGLQIQSHHPAIRAHLAAMIPPYLAQQLAAVDASALAVLLVQDNETPVLIWNARLRAELLLAIETYAGSMETFDWKSAKHTFAELASEPTVHDIYLRVLVAQPDFAVPFPDLLVIEISKALAPADLPAASAAIHAEALDVLLVKQPMFTESLVKGGMIPLIARQISSPEPVRSAVLGLCSVLSTNSSGAIAVQAAAGGELLRMLHSSSERDALLLRVLNVLVHMAHAQPECVLWIADSGALVSVLQVFATTTTALTVRTQATRVVGALCCDPVHGRALSQLMLTVLAPPFAALLQAAYERPTELLQAFDDDSQTPAIAWEEGMRADVRNMLLKEYADVDRAVQARDTKFKWKWSKLDGRFERSHLRAQLCVGGVFVANFVAQPFFAIPHPPLLNSLYEAIGVELDVMLKSSGETASKAAQNVALMWDAVATLLKKHLKLLDSSEVKHILAVPLFKRLLLPDVPVSVLGSLLVALELVSRNEDVLDAMARADIVRCVVRVAHQNVKCRLAALSALLCMTERSMPCIEQLRTSGGVIVLMHVLLTAPDSSHREKAAEVMSTMALRKPFGARVKEDVELLTTKIIAENLKFSPEAFVKEFDSSHSAPPRAWNTDSKQRLREYVAAEADKLTAAHDEWDGISARWTPAGLHVVWSDLAPPPTDDSPTPASNQAE